MGDSGPAPARFVSGSRLWPTNGAPPQAPAPPMASCAPGLGLAPIGRGRSLMQVPTLQPWLVPGSSLHVRRVPELGSAKFSFHARSGTPTGVPSSHITSTLCLLSASKKRGLAFPDTAVPPSHPCPCPGCSESPEVQPPSRGPGSPCELGQLPTVTSRRRGASLPLTLRVPFLPCQVQQLQQVPVSHVYPSQVQYVEGGDASYTASAM